MCCIFKVKKKSDFRRIFLHLSEEIKNIVNQYHDTKQKRLRKYLNRLLCTKIEHTQKTPELIPWNR